MERSGGEGVLSIGVATSGTSPTPSSASDATFPKYESRSHHLVAPVLSSTA